LILTLIFLRMLYSFFFFFITPPTPQMYTLSLHDALPISKVAKAHATKLPPLEVKESPRRAPGYKPPARGLARYPWAISLTLLVIDRKSTRLNSSHGSISYAVFCLKKKKKNHRTTRQTSST